MGTFAAIGSARLPTDAPINYNTFNSLQIV